MTAMPAKYAVCLSAEQRDQLDALTRTGTHHARTIGHARALLLTDASADGPAWDDERIAAALGRSAPTVARLRKRFLCEGLDEAIRTRKGGAGRPPKIDGLAEAHLITLACSAPPKGRAAWTLRLLTDAFVALDVCSVVSHETVRQTLKKTSCGLTACSSG